MLEEFQVKIDVKLPDQKGGTLRRLSALAEKFHKRMKKNFCVMAKECQSSTRTTHATSEFVPH